MNENRHGQSFLAGMMLIKAGHQEGPMANAWKRLSPYLMLVATILITFQVMSSKVAGDSAAMAVVGFMIIGVFAAGRSMHAQHFHARKVPAKNPHCYHSMPDPKCMASTVRDRTTLFGASVRVPDQKQIPTCCRCEFGYRGPEEPDQALSLECEKSPAKEIAERLASSGLPHAG